MTTGPAAASTPEVVLHEQRLHVDSERTPAERVVLRRRISTEVRQVEVTVRREELEVIRLPLTGQPTGPAPRAQAALVIVLSKEVPVVQLHTRPYEQVTVSVRTITTEQELTDSLDREQAEVTTQVAGEDAPTEGGP